MTTLDLEAYLERRRAKIDRALDETLPSAGTQAGGDPARLAESMRYSVLGGGKRLRPVLTLAAFEALGGKDEARALRAACAVELVHCYSLVHDDLPAMDDDDMRRGRPTVHRAFGEAVGVLCGDALLTLAFELCAEVCPHAVLVLAKRAGWQGMIEGQARDLALAGKRPTMDELEQLHATKTGALFAAAAELGMLCATACGSLGHEEPAGVDMRAYGTAFGIAFQHADDFDDADHVHLAEAARVRVRELCERAIAQVEVLGPASEPLRALARRIAARA